MLEEVVQNPFATVTNTELRNAENAVEKHCCLFMNQNSAHFELTL